MKSFIKISVLFILGMVLGALLMGWFTHSKVKEMRHRAGKGFVEFAKNKIDLDESEKEKLKPIFKEFRSIQKEQHKEFMKSRVAMFDSLLIKTEEVLDEESQTRLKEYVDKIKLPPHPKRRKRPKR